MRALAHADGQLFVGGAFASAGEAAANNVASWSGQAWEPLGLGTNGTVNALCATSEGLYAGGSFTAAGGVPAGGIARWQEGAWSDVSGSLIDQEKPHAKSATVFNGPVHSLQVGRGILYVGGRFTQVDGVAARSLAQWDGAAWGALSGPDGDGVDGPVLSLALGESLLVGGVFSQAGGQSSANFASWTPSPSVSLGNVTGAWYDPQQDGHGLIVQQLAGGYIFAAWFTFDPAGRQAWIVGDGFIEAGVVELTNLRPGGTSFIPNFDPSQVERQSFGNMTLNFSSCEAGSVQFDMPEPFGSGSMPLRRLTKPLGVDCDGTLGEAKDDPVSMATGAWYDPAQDGHGLMVESLANGVLLATWFTFEPAPSDRQAWFIGIDQFVGNAASMSTLKPEGGRFIPNFDPALVIKRDIGPMVFTVESCSRARVEFQLADGFGQGEFVLTRLTTPEGIDCRDP